MIIKYFIVACLLFILLDATWIGSNYNYYNNLAKKIQKEPIKTKLIALFITYIFLIISLYFCIRYIELEVKNKDYLKIFLFSSLFGICVYGIYSYTTCVFLNNYSYYNAFIDTIWATVLYSVPSLLYFYLK